MQFKREFPRKQRRSYGLDQRLLVRQRIIRALSYQIVFQCLGGSYINAINETYRPPAGGTCLYIA